MSVIWIIIVCLVCLAVIFISLLGIYLLVSSLFMKYAPPVRSSGKLKQAILSDIAKELDKLPNGRLVVDLGSGWGTLLVPLAKKFPQHQFLGIERAFLPYLFSCFRVRKLDNISFLRQDFYQYNLKKADIVVMFLIGFMMPTVTEKIVQEVKGGAKIYASRFPLVNIQADEVISLGSKMETYYIYKFRDNKSI